MHIAYSREEVPLGTAGSVKNAEDLLDEPFLVISGDALTDFDLTKIIKFHNDHKSMATHHPRPCRQSARISASSSPTTRGHIRQFLEKPSWSEVFSDTINTGIYVLDPKILSYFEKDKPFDFSQELFPMMLETWRPDLWLRRRRLLV